MEGVCSTDGSGAARGAEAAAGVLALVRIRAASAAVIICGERYQKFIDNITDSKGEAPRLGHPPRERNGLDTVNGGGYNLR